MVSSRPHTYSAEGVVVRMHDIGEADRLLVVLTPHRGVVRCVARGARKPKSKLGGHLDMLRHVSLSIREGRNLDNVAQAETLNGFRTLRSDLSKMSLGVYFGELAERFSVEGHANPALFQLLVHTFKFLEQTHRLDLLARWFEMRMLHLNGFMPELVECVESGVTLDPRDHLFSPERGGVVSIDARPPGSEALLPAPVNTIKLLRFLGRSNWQQTMRLNVTERDLKPAERILQEHLCHVLDRQVRSSAFVNEVRSWNGQPNAASDD